MALASSTDAGLLIGDVDEPHFPDGADNDQSPVTSLQRAPACRGFGHFLRRKWTEFGPWKKKQLAYPRSNRPRYWDGSAPRRRGRAGHQFPEFSS
jgi:hypothetical protein